MDDRPPGRFLGIDHGTKRIGLAISDPDAGFASPLETIAAGPNFDDCIRAMLAAASGFEVAAMVVGLPLNMDGSEGKQAKIVRRFGKRLLQLTDKPVYFWDERLTSVAAESHLRDAGLTNRKRKARIDRVAAQVLLQTFLDAQGWKNPD